MNRIIHFEIQSADVPKTQAFFKQVLGWSFSKWEGPQTYWLVTTGEGDGINGGMMTAPDGQPRTVNVAQVESIDKTVSKVEKAGGQICVPKFAVPGMGWVAYFLDPTGVLMGIAQMDPNAK
jgi:predicted enzyme related to lactoylglutathione lyase